MSRLFSRPGPFASLAVACALFAPSASAHISVDQGGTHKSRYGDTFLKEGPCGKKDGTRSTNVYTYEPGSTIKVSIVEFIPHPSYFRVAFDDDGDDGFVPPASIDPIDPNRPCPYNAADKCGAADYYNSPAVLPMMDDLDPHLTAMAGQKYTFDVKLPDVECDNCTLQIIQVMEDTIHGAYNPVQGDPNDVPYIDDVYYQCIDLVLQKGAGGATADAGAPGGEEPGPDGGQKPAPNSGSSGGCSVTTGPLSDAPADFALFFLACAGAVRRRCTRRSTRSLAGRSQ